MSVAQTFAISWESLADEESDRQVFKLCGYFAPNLPLPALQDFSGLREDDLEEALNCLKALALLRQNGTLHPLMAEFARLQDPQEELLFPWARALAWECHPSNPESGGVWREPLLARHAHYALADLRRACEQGEDLDAGILNRRTAFLLRHFGEMEPALSCLLRSLAIYGQLDDVETDVIRREKGMLLYAMAYIYRVRGELEQALALYGQSLEIAESLRDWQGKAITLGMLGQLSWQKGEHPQTLRAPVTGLFELNRLGIEPQTQQAMRQVLQGWRLELGPQRFDGLWQQSFDEPVPDWLK
jgi:tetratricopeptide (TPR) repeat protein